MRKLDISNSIDRNMLYDNDESGFYTFKFNLQIENQQIEIKASDFYNNPLAKLKNVISEQAFQQILVEGEFIKDDELIEKYLGTELLQVYFCHKNLKNPDEKLLFTFSFAEIQPTRFRLYLESIWKE